jgi:hypothetical protein
MTKNGADEKKKENPYRIGLVEVGHRSFHGGPAKEE